MVGCTRPRSSTIPSVSSAALGSYSRVPPVPFHCDQAVKLGAFDSRALVAIIRSTRFPVLGCCAVTSRKDYVITFYLQSFCVVVTRTRWTLVYNEVYVSLVNQAASVGLVPSRRPAQLMLMQDDAHRVMGILQGMRFVVFCLYALQSFFLKTSRGSGSLCKHREYDPVSS